MMSTVATHDDELERIRAAYRQRDAAPAQGPTTSAWASPAYAFYMQELEWDLTRFLTREGVALGGARVLEVGCGSGYFLHRFVEYGAAHAAGIDLMEDRIAQARTRYPTLEVVAGDASALPWDDGAFDLVTQFTCLSSVLDPDLRARIAAEMWRVTAPGGAVLSYDMRSIPRPLSLAHAAQRRLAGAPASAPAGTPTTPIDVAELHRLFPRGTMRQRPASLELGLAGLAHRGRWIAQAASLIRPLRTHLLAVVRKPAG